MLVLDPLERLGAGHENSDNKIDKLKAHPFFANIDWQNLKNTTPPKESSKPQGDQL